MGRTNNAKAAVGLNLLHSTVLYSTAQDCTVKGEISLAFLYSSTRRELCVRVFEAKYYLKCAIYLMNYVLL